MGGLKKTRGEVGGLKKTRGEEGGLKKVSNIKMKRFLRNQVVFFSVKNNEHRSLTNYHPRRRNKSNSLRQCHSYVQY